jgi:deazaflavin-dependent oxidoreductase (nitroreductase family)
VTSFNDRTIAEFRANGGRVGGLFEGADLLLLTTAGAGTGRPRTNPVGYVRDGARLLVFGSNSGQETHPGWYHNLVVNPSVTVEVGTGAGVETFPAHAVPLQDEERDRLFAAHAAALVPDQERTGRVIPVVALYPTQGANGRVAALGDHLVQVHDYFRRQLAAARAGARDAAGDGAGVDLREHCLALCSAVHQHHTREDGFFPEVQALVPGLEPVLDRLRADHVMVAERLRRFRELLAEERSDGDADVGAELDRLAADLEAHFDYEERMLVPVLNMSAS